MRACDPIVIGHVYCQHGDMRVGFIGCNFYNLGTITYFFFSGKKDKRADQSVLFRLAPVKASHDRKMSLVDLCQMQEPFALLRQNYLFGLHPLMNCTLNLVLRSNIH